jgi:hypothetical protein
VTASGRRRSPSPWLRAAEANGAGGGGTLASPEVAAEFSTEELLEFLEAGAVGVDADPAFRERLREQLWEMVKRGLDGS